jgi:hypothetical protein
MNPQNIEIALKTFILNEHLPKEDPAALTEAMPLMTTGILSSLAGLKVMAFWKTSLGLASTRTKR